MFKGEKIIIPKSMRQEMLTKIHTGHMGIQKSKERRVLAGHEQRNRQICRTMFNVSRASKPSSKGTITSPLHIPSRPWQIIGTDLFWWNNTNYLLVVDYHSNFPEICRLLIIRRAVLSSNMPNQYFARYGIPEVVISDNGPQYASQKYEEFANA